MQKEKKCLGEPIQAMLLSKMYIRHFEQLLWNWVLNPSHHGKFSQGTALSISMSGAPSIKAAGESTT